MTISAYAEKKIADIVAENAELRRVANDTDRKVAWALGQGRPLGAYLASPYAHIDPAVRSKRYYYAVAGVAELYRRDPHAYHFSPIVHSYPIVQYMPALRDLPWVEMDLAVLRCCTRFVVLKIDGWEESEGILRETEEACRRGIPCEELEL